MGRPRQDGLLYFSFDTDFFYADQRIKRLHSRYGSDGMLFYIYLLTEIYRNGYYIRWDEESKENAMDDLHLSEGLIEQIMTFLISRSLLYKSTLTGSDTIITSPGIQKRYQEAIRSRKRDIYVDPEIWLLNEEDTAAYIKVAGKSNKSCGNDSLRVGNESKSVGNDIKERKGKERKEKERKENTVCTEPEHPASMPPMISLILNDKTYHDIFQKDIDGWRDLYPAVDIIQELRKMKGWLDSNPARRKTRRGIDRFINSWLARAQDNGYGIRRGSNAGLEGFMNG